MKRETQIAVERFSMHAAECFIISKAECFIISKAKCFIMRADCKSHAGTVRYRTISVVGLSGGTRDMDQ